MRAGMKGEAMRVRMKWSTMRLGIGLAMVVVWGCGAGRVGGEEGGYVGLGVGVGGGGGVGRGGGGGGGAERCGGAQDDVLPAWADLYERSERAVGGGNGGAGRQDLLRRDAGAHP